MQDIQLQPATAKVNTQGVSFFQHPEELVNDM